MNTDFDAVYTSAVELPIGPDEAFALVTEPERLRRWTSVAATVDLRAGGAWHWEVTPGHTAGGTIREVDPGRRVVFGGGGWARPCYRPTRRRSPSRSSRRRPAAE
jgi:Activator of Hsp90 ATPase homolog 1-like protein